MALTSRPVRRSRVCPCQMLCVVASTVRHWVSVRWKSSSMAGMQGASTIPQRKEMLTQKQAALRSSIQELEDSVAYIDWKQNFYDEVLSGKRPYVSNLIPPENL